MHRLLVAPFLALFVHCALGCDPTPGWRPPSPTEAFFSSSVVLHARVVSQQGLDPSVVNVQVLHLLKGPFSGRIIHTASHSLCGVGQLEVGAEYVFFIPDEQRLFVTHLNQPKGLSTEQVLRALRITPK